MKNSNETSKTPHLGSDDVHHDNEPIELPKRPILKTLPGIVGVGFIALLMTLGVWSFVAWISTSDEPLEQVSLGEPLAGTLGPETPMGAAQKPFIDYSLRVPAMGQYSISLVSNGGESYDPYLSLLREGNIIASDNDSGLGNNALITTQLRPGEYTVRVTNYHIGRLDTSESFELQVTPVGRIAELLERSSTPEG